VAPGPFDVAVWNNSTMSSAARAAALGANLSWSGMRVIAAGGSTSIPSGNALTVGPGGIRVQNSNDLNLHTVVVGADQTWTLGSSRAISVSGALRGENVVLNVAGQSSSYMNITGSAADFSGTFNYGAGARLRLRAAFQATRLDLNVTSGTSVSAEGTIGTVRIGNLRTANTAASLGNTDQNGAVTYEIGHLGMDGTWTGLIRNGASDLSRVTTIHKLGGGSWTLTRGNTYTGNTTVGGGALMVTNTSGSATGSGNVLVKEGAMLGGTGIIIGPLTIEDGGILSPGPGGSGTGVLQLSNTVILAGETRITVNRASSPNASRLSGITSLTLGGDLVLTNSGPPLQAGDNFSLFTAGEVSGSFTSLQLPQLDSGMAWETSSLHPSGSVSVVSTRTAFEDWQHAEFTEEQLADPSVSGPNVDPNRDGVVNKLEFFLNRDPLGPNVPSSLPRIALNGGYLEFLFTRRIAAVNEMIHAVEWSDDLGGGFWSDNGVTEEVIGQDTEVQHVKAAVPLSPHGRRFVRLRVE
jgi:autotransporter-associated beta strand protein